MQSTSCEIRGWMNHKLELRLLGVISKTLAESEEDLKSLLMYLKQESEKAGLILNSQKTKIMASSPITSWQIEREKVGTVTDLYFGASKSLQMGTVAMKLKDACSLEEKL